MKPRRPRPWRRLAKRRAPPPRRGQDHDAHIEKRIAAGEPAEAFLCIDCFCWNVDPAFCACWSRAVFPH